MLYSPETLVSIDVNANKEKIKEAKVLWVLTKEFTEQLKQVYDVNQNNYIDKDEIEPIEQSLLDYVVPKNYLTHISYDKIINKEKSNKIEVSSHRVFIRNSRLHFEYTIKLDYKTIKDNILYIHINDDETYFILLLAKNSVKIHGLDDVNVVENKQSAAFYINTGEVEKVEEKKEQPVAQPKVKPKADESLLVTYTKKIKQYLLKIDKGDNLALFTLLFASFIYGIVHALGPGHGKSLAFSYFLSNRSSYLKAFFISQASAFIHIIGALILVVVSVFILESFLNNFVKDSVSILTKVSALLIVALSIFIFYNKMKKKGCSCSSCCSSNKPSTQIWSTEPASKSTKLKPNFMKKDLYFVLTAGLIPCPGTVILFIYAFVLKTYYAVLLASIFISLGMGIVIFASSFLGVSLKKATANSHKITNFFEILAPIVMFILGVVLFIGSSNL